MQPLEHLIRETPGARLERGTGDVLVRRARLDSRLVTPGDLFVAAPGLRSDGRRYVADAIRRGAAAIVAETSVETGPQVPLVLVPDARAALADLAAALVGHPSRSMLMIGVTGTDGKTTVSRLVAEIMQRAGHRVGWITTVDVRVGDSLRKNPYGHTTPEAPEIQETLAEMRDDGVTLALVEASSHALAQHRLRACEFDLAIFTNLASEHLNFHGSLEAYLQAKALLFETVGLRYSILNADSPSLGYLESVARGEIWTYGLDRDADLVAERLALRLDGADFHLRWRGEGAPAVSRLSTRFPARFNVSNWLAALLAAHVLGAPSEAIERAAEEVSPPPGRMQEIRAGQPFRVVVDFSHTPHALAAALRELRPHTAGRLLVAFGHAGERDPQNRPAMGEAAARFADYFAITTDDPMDEVPADIAARVADGAVAQGLHEGPDFAVILDRREAFAHLIERAEPGDCVLLAGRGHEIAMPVAGRDLPFDDVQVAIELLAERGYTRSEK